MNRAMLSSLFAVALTVTGIALAQDGKVSPPAQSPGTAHNHLAAPGGPAQATASGQMAQMDAQMKQMQATHARVMNAVTPEEKQKAMAEERQAMQACMAMMSNMQGGTMGGGMMGQKAQPADMNTQMQLMNKRLDMMQMMMQSMLDQQAMAGAVKASDAAPKQ